jgi:hypothetical protein
MFDEIYFAVDKRFHPGNIYGEASEECQRGDFWVDRRCNYFDDKAETQYLFLHGGLL